jgi:hypothetical protein
VDVREGEWEVLYLFRQEGGTAAQCFVGYLTIFIFNNPLKGQGLRICQILILPPFQRQGTSRLGGVWLELCSGLMVIYVWAGHGARMLRWVYESARSRELVFEVTVEDPAPTFSMLRNGVDLQDLLLRKVKSLSC